MTNLSVWYHEEYREAFDIVIPRLPVEFRSERTFYYGVHSHSFFFFATKSVCKDFTNFRTSPFDDFCQKRELFLFSCEILAKKKNGYINVAKSIAYLRVIYLLLLKYFFD